MFPNCAEMWYVASHLSHSSRLSLLSSPNLAAMDNRYEAQLRNALADKYGVFFIGHASKAYAHPDQLRSSMARNIHQIMETKCLRPEQVIVVARGMSQGIGEVYPVARSMGIETLGIVARQGERFRSPDCHTLITVDNGSEEDWATKMPASREEMMNTALRIANSNLALGGEVIAYNGGPRAYRETLAAAQQGFPVSVVTDFDPVETNRGQPFKNPAAMDHLQRVILDNADAAKKIF